MMVAKKKTKKTSKTKKKSVRKKTVKKRVRKKPIKRKAKPAKKAVKKPKVKAIGIPKLETPYVGRKERKTVDFINLFMSLVIATLVALIVYIAMSHYNYVLEMAVGGAVAVWVIIIIVVYFVLGRG